MCEALPTEGEQPTTDPNNATSPAGATLDRVPVLGDERDEQVSNDRAGTLNMLNSNSQARKHARRDHAPVVKYDEVGTKGQLFTV